MASLEALSASCNAFDDTALAQICAGCTQLSEVYLRGNKVANPASLGALAALPRLRILWIADNPLCSALSKGDLRSLVCHLVGPGLEILDNDGEVAFSERVLPTLRATSSPQPRGGSSWLARCMTWHTARPLYPAAVTDDERMGRRPLDDPHAVRSAAASAAARFPDLGIVPYGGPPAHPAPAAPGPRWGRADNEPSRASADPDAGRLRDVPALGAWAGPGPGAAELGGASGAGGARQREDARSGAARVAARTEAGAAGHGMLTAVMALLDHMDEGALQAVRRRCEALLPPARG